MEDRDGGKGPMCEHGEDKDNGAVKKSGKHPCGVCQTGVGSTNAILCGGCKCWVNKKCSTWH